MCQDFSRTSSGRFGSKNLVEVIEDYILRKQRPTLEEIKDWLQEVRFLIQSEDYGNVEIELSDLRYEVESGRLVLQRIMENIEEMPKEEIYDSLEDIFYHLGA